jgi:hypothetical protein
MAVLSRPFAYNTTGPISGTDQVGDLAIGYPTSGFDSTPGVQWWIGPSEATGYVIAKPIVLGNQPTQVTEDALYLNPAAKGTDVVLSNNDQTAGQAFSYAESVLGLPSINGGQYTMFSIRYNSTNGNSLDQRVIGVGQVSFGYGSTYPGGDARSIGFSADGKFLFSGSAVALDLAPWNDGDIIDIALITSPENKIWIRINGGEWNNNPSGDPTNPAGSGLSMQSLDNVYPALCPGYLGSTMTVLNYPPFGVPSGYNFLGNVSASVGFNRSSDLTEGSFIEIAETLTGQTFATGNDAKTYLNSNGYWTSWV